MQEQKKIFELSIIITSPDTFDLEMYEPESGDFTRIECHDNGESIKSENERLVNEIRSWVSIMRDNEVI